MSIDWKNARWKDFIPPDREIDWRIFYGVPELLKDMRNLAILLEKDKEEKTL